MPKPGMAKTEFVATVSHELRTPMTSIAGFVELLQDDVGNTLSEDQKSFVDAIRRNSDRLTALADELLMLSSLESGPFVHQQVDVDLRQVVLATQAVLEPAIKARNLEVNFDVPPGPVMVHGDVQNFESVVSNLLTNALKFTKDGGWVRCRLRVVAGRVRLEVSDNGFGIPQDEQADAVQPVLPVLHCPRTRHPGFRPRSDHRRLDRAGVRRGHLGGLRAHGRVDLHREPALPTASHGRSRNRH